MNAQLLDGRKLADHLQTELTSQVQQRIAQGAMPPTLAVILVGNHPASLIYIQNKRRAAEKIGIHFRLTHLPETTDQRAILSTIQTLNEDIMVHGILVQLPLPEPIDTNRILEAIDPAKDVDGFHPYNLGRLAQKRPLLRPCTPYGIIRLLKAYDIPLEGKNVTILGASLIVGLPLLFEMLIENATVTICHIYTDDVPSKTQDADIVVSAVGKRHFVQSDWIKPGAIVVDVGVHRLDDGTLAGDVDFDAIKTKASWITPVPGGVGPMTVATLMDNTVRAWMGG